MHSQRFAGKKTRSNKVVTLCFLKKTDKVQDLCRKMIHSLSSTTRWRTGYETNTVTVALWLIQNERKSSKGNALFPIWALSVSHGINSHTLYAVLQQIPVQNSGQNYTIALSPWTKLLNFFVGVPFVLQPPPPPPPPPHLTPFPVDLPVLMRTCCTCACLRVLNACVCVCAMM